MIENYVVLSRDAADARIYFIGSARFLFFSLFLIHFAQENFFFFLIRPWYSFLFLSFYFSTKNSENELIIFSALNAYYEAVCSLLRDYVDKRTILENLDYVILALDEVIDGGYEIVFFFFFSFCFFQKPRS